MIRCTMFDDCMVLKGLDVDDKIKILDYCRDFNVKFVETSNLAIHGSYDNLWRLLFELTLDGHKLLIS